MPKFKSVGAIVSGLAGSGPFSHILPHMHSKCPLNGRSEGGSESIRRIGGCEDAR